PPVNTQSLKEIDLQEILKNPQLRHDILFDPQLQFRPNLDGDRGRRKKLMVDKYWLEIQGEFCSLINDPKSFKLVKLPKLFTTLKDILISLLPEKDRNLVNQVLDKELLIQQLRNNCLDFISLSNWLANVFKNHCAPMRDTWVDEMTLKFLEAETDHSIPKLVDGLRMVFAILEAMKLDIANHQIRTLRPVLVETSLEFEKDYYNQLISVNKIDIKDSLEWFKSSYKKYASSPEITSISKVENLKSKVGIDLKRVCISAILNLLSCRNMTSEFPLTLSFDNSRLALLRAEIRQLVCLQICLYIFRQLVLTHSDKKYRGKLLTTESLKSIKNEILAIITDDNGYVKWTRNIPSISLYLAKKVISNPEENSSKKSNIIATPPESLTNLVHSWLLKQTQPKSKVYGLMESKIISELNTLKNNCNKLDGARNVSGENNLSNHSFGEELMSLSSRLYTLSVFHWNVFGSYYAD
ncbi:Sok1p, partial [Ascoidea rubescens DSM 1968]